MYNIPKEMCVEVGELKQCMSGEYLIVALLLEITFYFIIFVGGVKLIEYLKRKPKGEKRGGKKI
tara:strand:- start:332 stop:523 length:192 start_codon:yes stop_codon:yes gene_type:complete